MKRDAKLHPARVPRRSSRPVAWILAILAVAVLALGWWILNGVRSTPRAASHRAAVAASPSLNLPPAEEELALRKEQIEAAQKLTAAFPQSDDAVYLLGLVHNEQGDSIGAMKEWERSLQLDASRADANDSLGYAHLLRDEYEKAETYFRRALALDPTLATANFRLATTLVQEGKMSEAISILTKASSLSAEGHRLLGEAYQNAKEFEKAKASYETAIKLKPDLSEAYYGLSKVCTRLGDREKGGEYFEKFTALKSQRDEEARTVRASYDTLGITRRSVAQTHTDVGRVFLIEHRPSEAEALWRRAAALDSSNALCRLQLAVLHHQARRYPEALKFYEEVARLDPSDALVQLNLGRVCLQLNLVEPAEAAFKRVVELAPERPEGHAALAQVREILAQKK